MEAKGQIARRRERIQRLQKRVEMKFRHAVEEILEGDKSLEFEDIYTSYKANVIGIHRTELIPKYMVDEGTRKSRVIEYIDLLKRAKRITEHDKFLIPTKLYAQLIFNEVKEALKKKPKKEAKEE
jgi:hypothetical protein